MNLHRLGMRVLPPVIPAIVFTALAELAVRQEWVARYLVPAPSKVFHTLATSSEPWKALGETAAASVIGFGVSAVAGVLLAILLSSASWIRQAFYPYAVFFQTVPIIAIAPLLVIWIGYGMRTVVASAVIVSVFPVIANTLNGLLSIDPAMRDLFKLYRASRFATLMKLRLPSALPQILTGLRIAAGLAVIGAIVGEFITGGGLGGFINASIPQQRVDKVFGGLLLSALLGITIFFLINLLSHRLLNHWHASEKTRQ